MIRLLDSYFPYAYLASRFLPKPYNVIGSAVFVVSSMSQFLPQIVASSSDLNIHYKSSSQGWATQKKFEHLNQIVEEVKKEIGLEEMNVKVGFSNRLRSNVLCYGNQFSLQRPTICLSGNYFKKSLTAEGDYGYQNFQASIQSFSDDPIILAHQLSQLPYHSKVSLYQGCLAYRDRLNSEELKAIIAHELGHAKNNDNLVRFGWIQVSYLCIASLVGYLVSLKTIRRADTRIMFTLLNYLPLLPSYSTVANALSRRAEFLADRQLVHNPKYINGGAFYFKKHVIEKALEKYFEHSLPITEYVKGKLNSFDLTSTHPNDVKRLAAIHQLKQDSTPISPLKIPVFNLVMSSVAVATVWQSFLHCVHVYQAWVN